MDKAKIMVIDDDRAFCDACTQLFEQDECLVETSFNRESALIVFDDFKPDIVFIDIMIPGASGLEIMEKLIEKDNTVVPIVVTGYATVETAVESMKKGAFDFLPKPFSAATLLDAAKRALDRKGSSLTITPSPAVRESVVPGHVILVAQLVAFVKPPDLPPSLHPFARSASWGEKLATAQNPRLLLLRIGGTVDSFHAMVITRDIGIHQIEDKIREDLGTVVLSAKTRAKIIDLLDKYRKGEFNHYINHKCDTEKYPYRH